MIEEIHENYPPEDSLIGNDDGSVKYDEDNNPYNVYHGDIFFVNHPVGQIASYDQPSFYISDRTGKMDGETFEMRRQFSEFVRLLIGGKWYPCSNFVLWREHFKFIRVNGGWENNKSELELNNNNF